MDGIVVQLSLFGKVSFDCIKFSLKIVDSIFGVVQLSLQTVLIGGRILELFVVKSPLSSFVVIVIYLRAVVADESIDMLLPSHSHSHDLFDC